MKNILKKILSNKKTKKVVKKKSKTVKKVIKPKKVSKVVKIKKVNKELNKKKIIKDSKKKDKVEIKTDPLRIPKNNEQKPELINKLLLLWMDDYFLFLYLVFLPF